ncbi:MAG: cupredoxin domain-containing protein [Pseudomonadota bacterium]|nr:cupredoxin domain-containing protein [Pseudomonadota bacterium]
MKLLTSLAAGFLVVASATAMAENTEYKLVIKDHMFEPITMQLPAGKRIKLTIENQDATAEEFEGFHFPVEKIIPGNSKAVVWVGPFKRGNYGFMGEFNQDSAKGEFVVE